MQDAKAESLQGNSGVGRPVGQCFDFGRDHVLQHTASLSEVSQFMDIGAGYPRAVKIIDLGIRIFR
jgi:hypothetical protein